jgi:hypothetical protein
LAVLRASALAYELAPAAFVCAHPDLSMLRQVVEELQAADCVGKRVELMSPKIPPPAHICPTPIRLSKGAAPDGLNGRGVSARSELPKRFAAISSRWAPENASRTCACMLSTDSTSRLAGRV